MKILKFYSDKCTPCKTLDKFITLWGEPKYEIQRVNIMTEHELRRRHKVTAVPTLVKVDENGDEISRSTGITMATKPFLYE